MMPNYEKPYLTSGRNTIIHKVRKYDLLLINGDHNPPVIVTHKGIQQYNGEVPDTKYKARQKDMELVDCANPDVFGDTRTLIFVQLINGKEYKVDFSKVGTNDFVRLHQENTLF
jgi:hypothetical protein